jgi:HSP20 family molecular chaperone IbpA
VQEGIAERLVTKLRSRMERLFGEMETAFRAPGGAWPALNVWEDEGRYYAESELPGVTALRRRS